MGVILIILGAIFFFIGKNIDDSLLLYYDEVNEKGDKIDTKVEQEYRKKTKRNYILGFILFTIGLIIILF